MAQKFGNGRWVEEGFLDNRIPGTVVGRVSFAGIGRVEVFLAGDFRGEIAGPDMCWAMLSRLKSVM